MIDTSSLEDLNKKPNPVFVQGHIGKACSQKGKMLCEGMGEVEPTGSVSPSALTTGPSHPPATSSLG